MSEKQKNMETQTQSVTVKNGYTVFVVEDSDVYRTILVEFITKLKGTKNGAKPDYAIHSFSSGEECLENIQLKPDVIILDYHLDSGGYIKNMDGLQLLKKVKGISPETEVVVLSCQNSVEVVKELLHEGAAEYIQKDNISQIKVSHLIENFLQRKERKKRMKLMASALISLLIAMAVIAIIYFLKK